MRPTYVGGAFGHAGEHVADDERKLLPAGVHACLFLCIFAIHPYLICFSPLRRTCELLGCDRTRHPFPSRASCFIATAWAAKKAYCPGRAIKRAGKGGCARKKVCV